MTPSDENEFDEGLRRVAESQGVEPSPALWNGIRLAALERQLITYQSAALWLKGIIGVLVALLGITGAFLYQAKNEPNQLVTQTVAPAKTDTVYVTRTETEQVFTDRPVVIYVEKKPNTSQPQNSNPNLDDKTNTLISSQQNDQSVREKEESFSQKTIPTSPLVRPELVGKDSRKNAENLATNDPESTALETLKNSGQPNNLSDAGKEKLSVSQKFTAEKSSITTTPKNSENRSRFATLDKNVTEQQVLSENGSGKRMVFDVPRLNALARKSDHSFKLPTIAYRQPATSLTAAVQPKVAKIRTPFSERLTLSAYAAPDWNKLDVRRDQADAFRYGDEELQAGILAGVRVGLKLSDKWSLLAGAEFSGSSFDEGKRRQVLAAESVNGQTGFPYRTALGTVVLPGGLLSSPPTANDRLGLEIHEAILRYALNLPLALRYDIWRKRFLLLNQVPLRFAAYGLLGGYAQIPLRQEGRVTVFEDSGREFEAELTGFQNLRPAYGLSLGAGAELGVGKHLSIFTEPTYVQGLTSVVRDMPLRTTIGGFNLKFGAKWGFGKK